MTKKRIFYLLIFIFAYGYHINIAVSREWEPLSFEAITGFVKAQKKGPNGPSEEIIIDLISEFHLNFEATDNNIQELVEIGASPPIIDAIRRKVLLVKIITDPKDARVKITCKDGNHVKKEEGIIGNNYKLHEKEKYNVKVSRKGYVPKDVEITVLEKNKYIYDLDVDWVTVNFQTEPPEAFVKIRDKENTPPNKKNIIKNKYELQRGTEYEAEVSSKGYITKTKSFKAKEGDSNCKLDIDWVTVNFQLDPPGTSVIISDEGNKLPKINKISKNEYKLQRDNKYEVEVSSNSPLYESKTYVIKIDNDSFAFKLPEKPPMLRSEYKKLTIDDMKKIKRFEFTKNRYGSKKYYGYCEIDHVYVKLEPNNKDGVVKDETTGLMWHQSGLQDENWEKVTEKVGRLNYAGYDDWRLPTLEEAISLLEREKERDYSRYLVKDFDKDVTKIWTNDTMDNSYTRWFVDFKSWSGFGFVSYGKTKTGNSTEPYITVPVRSMKLADYK